MKKIKKYIIMVLFLLGIFFNITEVDATENEEYVDCYYDVFKVYYNRVTDEFSINITISDPRYLILETNNLIKSNFVKKETNELYCPTLYKTVYQQGYNMGYRYYADQQENSSTVDYDKEKSKIVNNTNNSKNIKTCVYGNVVEYILDIDKKEINSFTVSGYSQSSPYTYDEVFDGQQCKNVKMYYFCYEYNNVKNCTASKTKRDQNFIEAKLNQNSSTGASDIPKNDDSDQEVERCEVFPKAIKDYIMQALKLIRWGGLVLMVVLGTLDFVKASASDDQDAIKKAGQNFIKRLIAVIILFLLPLLVELILFIVGKIGFNFGECYKVSEF